MLLTLLRSTGTQPYIKVSGTWQFATATYIKVSGTWQLSAPYFKVSGAWL